MRTKCRREQKTRAYILQLFSQINPQHTVPTLVDDDGALALWESRAIMTYLVARYAANDTLYPSDVRSRALVDQRLQFDLGTLYPRMIGHYVSDGVPNVDHRYRSTYANALQLQFPPLFFGAPVDESKKTEMKQALGFFDEMLHDRIWSAGDGYTVADVTLTVTVAQMEAFNADLKQYPRVDDWLQRSKTLLKSYGYDAIMGDALKMMAGAYKEKWPQ